MKRIPQITDRNRFDLLRLIFASLVFFYHMIALAKLNSFLEGQLSILAELSIQCFFVISGALVFASFSRSNSLGIYFEKRVRRLWPAYLVIIAIPTFFAIFYSGQLQESVQYFLWNGIFLNFIKPNLPGLFQNNPMTEVNGALWTIKIEVMFYAVLPILAWIISRIGKFKWVLLFTIYICAEIWRQAFAAGLIPLPDTIQNYSAQISRQLPGQMSFFVIGIAMYMMWDKAKTASPWMLVIGLCIVITTILFPATLFLRALGLGMLISYLAFVRGPQMDVARYGDISYGVYIVHFPIIQTVIALGLFSLSPLLAILVTIVLVYSSSVVLWHVIEKKMLLPSSYYLKRDSKASSDS